jgi:hypothetical protein
MKKSEKASKTEKAEVVLKPRAAKEYVLQNGTLPEQVEGQKMPYGFRTHAYVLTEAVIALKDEGAEKATAVQIMDKAVSLGLFDPEANKYGKASRQPVAAIFSFWRKPLRELGWISNPAKELAPSPEAA